jgi:hypothetical protein
LDRSLVGFGGVEEVGQIYERGVFKDDLNLDQREASWMSVEAVSRTFVNGGEAGYPPYFLALIPRRKAARMYPLTSRHR